jgi:hypothetical protein
MIYSNLLVVAYCGIKISIKKCEKQLKKSDAQIKAAESSLDIINKYISSDRNDIFLLDIMDIMCYISCNKYQKELDNIHNVIVNLLTILIELNKLYIECVPLIRCFIAIEELWNTFLIFCNDIKYNTFLVTKCNSYVCKGEHKELTKIVSDCVNIFNQISIYTNKLMEIAALIVDSSKYILNMIEVVFEKEFGSD